ncbi:DUF1573 domain-containing protein [uncultured Bacteroides sp.]|uniref:DUF1573 domain-containing protein n=2 Tax=uncultured Bacteroides sp. TaxID=162156 RepID=UPI002592D445|nr:DUF1573 domain-containing protein [uncultured Bacteroides sp.]
MVSYEGKMIDSSRNMVRVVILFFVVCMCFFSCQRKGVVNEQVLYWQDREILFPQKNVFTLFGKDTVDMLFDSPYKILSYLDSMGCVSCKAQFPAWKEFLVYLEQKKVPVLFFMGTRRLKEMQFILRRETFGYPVCIDEKDSLNKLNHFSSDLMFQTFLLDKDNKVLAIGNPIHNPKVKELYLKIIQGEKIGSINESNVLNTMVDIDKTAASLGDFAWQEERKATFILKNMGNKPLFISDVTTSCGCTSVDYSKEPVNPSDSLRLHVIYKADHPGYFSKTITVYCNADASPIRLKISGNAK